MARKRNVRYTVQTDCDRCGNHLEKVKELSEAELSYHSYGAYNFSIGATSLGLHWVEHYGKAHFLCNDCYEEYGGLEKDMNKAKKKAIDAFFKI